MTKRRKINRREQNPNGGKLKGVVKIKKIVYQQLKKVLRPAKGDSAKGLSKEGNIFNCEKGCFTFAGSWKDVKSPAKR